MVVMPTFAPSQERYQLVFRSLNRSKKLQITTRTLQYSSVVPVVWPSTPSMSHTVNRPSKMKTNDKTQHASCAKRYVQILIPEIPWYHSRYHQRKNRCQNRVVLFLESYDWVGLKVAHVHGFAQSGEVWVFVHQQPSHMGEEETPFDAVGVGVGVCEFVVDPVVMAPHVDAVLESYSLENT